MNLFTILQTIQKLKAGMSVLIGKDADKMKEVVNLYFQNATIYGSIEAQKKFDDSKNDFMRFLERDERENHKK